MEYVEKQCAATSVLVISVLGQITAISMCVSVLGHFSPHSLLSEVRSDVAKSVSG